MKSVGWSVGVRECGRKRLSRSGGQEGGGRQGGVKDREGGREGGRRKGEGRREVRKGSKEGKELATSKHAHTLYSSWVWVGEEGNVSNHLLVGKLIILCVLDHSIIYIFSFPGPHSACHHFQYTLKRAWRRG